MDRMADGKWRRDYQKCRKGVDSRAVLSVKPDILILQEIGDSSYLEELRADLEFYGFSYSHAVHMEAADEQRHLAMLSQ